MRKVTIPKPLAKALADDRGLTRVLFERPPPLSAILPYGEFSQDSSIWRLKDGSLGAVFSASLFEHETMTGDQIVAAVRGLSPWLSLPESCTLQVLYDQSLLPANDARIEALDDGFEAAHPVSKMLFDARLKRLKTACDARGDEAPFVRRLFLAIRHFPHGEKPKMISLRRDERFVLEQAKNSLREMKDFRAICADFVANSVVTLRAVNDQELATVLRQFFNPVSFYNRTFLKLAPHAPFADQLIYSQSQLDHQGIEREGVRTRTISLKTSPQLVYPGGMAYLTRLSFPFRLALNISFPSPGQVRKFFDMKEFFLENTPSARSRRQREEILAVQDQLARDDRCVRVTFSLVVEGTTDDELEQRARAVTSTLQNDLGCDSVIEDRIGLGLCLNTLPLMYTPKADYSSQRFVRILRSDATKLLPVFDSFRGLASKDAPQIYLSRERNLVPFSLTSNETSNHTVVLADTGSGKSAFVIDCIQAGKRQSPEPLVFVIDKKSSYLMLSEYFDANLTVFQRGRPVPFSPFRGVFDDEKVAFLTNLIAAGVKLMSPSFKMEGDQLTLIAKAIRQAQAAKVNQEGLAYVDGNLRKSEDGATASYISMDDVVQELAALPAMAGFERFQKETDELVAKLGSFYGDGLYAPFFRGSAERQETKSKLFFIYDLDALDSDPKLQALMTMAVVEEIRQTIKLPENRGRGGFIVLEELGLLGRDNPYASQFIRDAAETFRKLGFWLIGLTPRPQNYFETEAGKAMWGAADNFIFLQMSEDNARYLAERSSLLDEAGLGIIKSLKTVRGKYSDVFYMNKKKTQQGAFRFVQTPLDRWLAPTNALDAAAAEKALKRAGGDKWLALAELAKGSTT